MSNPDFLQRLQQEAELQAKIHSQRWLPAQLDPLATLIAKYSWQTLALAAIITSLVLQFGASH